MSQVGVRNLFIRRKIATSEKFLKTIYGGYTNKSGDLVTDFQCLLKLWT